MASMDENAPHGPKYPYWSAALREAVGAWAERRRLALAIKRARLLGLMPFVWRG